MLPIMFSRGIPFLLVAVFVSNGVATSSRFCSWNRHDIICNKDQFQCFNSKCIKRSWYCDNGNDCGDNSDEQYCSVSSCPTKPSFKACENSRKCIPEEWICDGFSDCPSGDDERDCEKNISPTTAASISKIAKWMHSQKSRRITEKWGSEVDKSAIILYFADRNITSSAKNETLKEMAYEISIQMLNKLSHMELQDVPTNDLASYVNAFLVLCLDPRKFHGYDLVQELSTRVQEQNYTNPYVFIALCNAGYSIAEYKEKLIETFNNKRRPFWTDTQALVIMALACATKTERNEEDQETMRQLSRELMQRQYRNGSVENFQTTALVMQALISTGFDKDPDYFDEIKALQEIQRNQKLDGSFGDLMNTYFVTPLLVCESLININSDHCHYEPPDENAALENLKTRSGPKIRVQYSLWIGNERDLERNLVLRVPVNTSMYGIMEIAAEIDSRYRFEYKVKDRKPYINGLLGLRDNPEKGKFWFLFTVQDGQPSPYNDSPADVIPQNNDHYVMWYRSGPWNK